MSSSLPTPVAAVLGIVPTLADRASRVPAKVVQLPLRAISHALTTVELVQRDYDEMAERGESLLRRLRGQAEEVWDDTEDRVEDAADRFAARAKQARDTANEHASQVRGTALDRVDDAGDTLRSVAGNATRSLGERAEKAERVVERAAERIAPEGTADTQQAGDAQLTEDAPDDDEQPKGHATPKATEPDATRVDTAVSPQVETVVEATVAPLVDEAPDRDELPLPDYDHMTLGSLRGRLRSLSLAELARVRAYEKDHADRLPVVTMLDNRIAKLAADPSAAPVGAPSTAPAPEQQAAAGKAGRSKVSPSTAATPSGPPTDSAPTRPLN